MGQSNPGVFKSRGARPPAVDGKIDTATHAALKRFQKTQGLQMTGRVNKATWRALGL
ncbi:MULTISPECIES: peptidoglycan-binding domain-containing protein [Acidiferrobacter]|uniref:peptidoglycan-binding domain-containing protein n=1 Tax=Acidiferrobacter TaxID=986106 RepID=UPI0014755081|nr:peptidoglycan-binding protein [Acidiferrobacter thiooxydans]